MSFFLSNPILFFVFVFLQKRVSHNQQIIKLSYQINQSTFIVHYLQNVRGNQTTGFRSGNYHVKVNAEKKIKVLCQLLSSGYICVLGSSITALQQS